MNFKILRFSFICFALYFPIYGKKEPVPDLIEQALSAKNPTYDQLVNLAAGAVHQSNGRATQCFKRLFELTAHPNPTTAEEAVAFVIDINTRTRIASFHEWTWHNCARRPRSDLLRQNVVKRITNNGEITGTNLAERFLETLVGENGSITIRHPSELELWNIYATNRSNRPNLTFNLPKISEVKFDESEQTNRETITSELKRYPELAKQLAKSPITPNRSYSQSAGTVACNSSLRATRVTRNPDAIVINLGR